MLNWLKMLTRPGALTVAAAVVAMPTSAWALSHNDVNNDTNGLDHPVHNLFVDLSELNDSGVQGTADLTLDRSDPDLTTLRVQLNTTGLALPGTEPDEGQPIFTGLGIAPPEAFLPHDNDNAVNGNDNGNNGVNGIINGINGNNGNNDLNDVNNDVEPVVFFPIVTDESLAGQSVPLATFDQTFSYDMTDEQAVAQLDAITPLLGQYLVVFGATQIGAGELDENGELIGLGEWHSAPVAAGEIVPEPGTAALVGVAVVGGIVAATRRRRNHNA